MDRAEVSRLLAKAPAISVLSPAVQSVVAAEMRPASFGAGQAIFSRGDPGKELYLVLSGRVRLSILTLEGRELSFWHAVEGDVFGEIAMLDGGPRTADATAVTAVTAASLAEAPLRRLVLAEPELAMALIRFLCGRVRSADMQLEGVALHRIEVRLARYLLGLVAARNPLLTGGIVEVELAISQGELALLLGASRPKVNGALVMLEEQGVITRRDSVLACDVAALRGVGVVG